MVDREHMDLMQIDLQRALASANIPSSIRVVRSGRTGSNGQVYIDFVARGDVNDPNWKEKIVRTLNLQKAQKGSVINTGRVSSRFNGDITNLDEVRMSVPTTIAPSYSQSSPSSLPSDSQCQMFAAGMDAVRISLSAITNGVPAGFHKEVFSNSQFTVGLARVSILENSDPDLGTNVVPITNTLGVVVNVDSLRSSGAKLPSMRSYMSFLGFVDFQGIVYGAKASYCRSHSVSVQHSEYEREAVDVPHVVVGTTSDDDNNNYNNYEAYENADPETDAAFVKEFIRDGVSLLSNSTERGYIEGSRSHVNERPQHNTTLPSAFSRVAPVVELQLRSFDGQKVESPVFNPPIELVFLSSSNLMPDSVLPFDYYYASLQGKPELVWPNSLIEKSVFELNGSSMSLDVLASLPPAPTLVFDMYGGIEANGRDSLLFSNRHLQSLVCAYRADQGRTTAVDGDDGWQRDGVEMSLTQTLVQERLLDKIHPVDEDSSEIIVMVRNSTLAMSCSTTHFTDFSVLLKESRVISVVGCLKCGTLESVFGSPVYAGFMSVFFAISLYCLTVSVRSIIHNGLSHWLLVFQHLLIMMTTLVRAATCGLLFFLESGGSRESFIHFLPYLLAIPLVLEMIVITLMVMAWAAIYHFASKHQGEDPFVYIRPYFLVINFVVLVLTIGLFLAAGQDSVSVFGLTTIQGRTITRVCSFIVATLYLISSISFAVYGSLLAKSLSTDFPSRHAKKILKVAYMTCVSLAAQSILIIVSFADEDFFFDYFNVLQSLFYTSNIASLVSVLYLFFSAVEGNKKTASKKDTHTSRTHTRRSTAGTHRSTVGTRRSTAGTHRSIVAGSPSAQASEVSQKATQQKPIVAKDRLVEDDENDLPGAVNRRSAESAASGKEEEGRDGNNDDDVMQDQQIGDYVSEDEAYEEYYDEGDEYNDDYGDEDNDDDGGFDDGAWDGFGNDNVVDYHSNEYAVEEGCHMAFEGNEYPVEEDGYENYDGNEYPVEDDGRSYPYDDYYQNYDGDNHPPEEDGHYYDQNYDGYYQKYDSNNVNDNGLNQEAKDEEFTPNDGQRTEEHDDRDAVERVMEEFDQMTNTLKRQGKGIR